MPRKVQTPRTAKAASFVPSASPLVSSFSQLSVQELIELVCTVKEYPNIPISPTQHHKHRRCLLSIEDMNTLTLNAGDRVFCTSDNASCIMQAWPSLKLASLGTFILQSLS